MSPSTGSQRIKQAISKRRHVAKGALLWIESVAAIATVAAIAIGLVSHFTESGETKLPAPTRFDAFVAELR